jgi:phage terminase small subunit
MAKAKKTIPKKKASKKPVDKAVKPKTANPAPTQQETEKDSLTAKQMRFCDEYLIDLNATQAAIRAGYSEKTAYAIGWENLRKPELRKIIDQKLEQCSLGKQETVKLLSDIAQGSLNEYFVTTKKTVTPQVQKPLKEIIKGLQDKIEDQRKLIARAKITNADTLNELMAQESEWRLRIIQYEIELERNPKAFRIVDGETQLVDTVELDLAKLVKDKERGKIKSITPNEYGLKIEMYPADAALRDIGRYHGIFEKDKEPPPPVNFNFSNLSADELKTLMALKQKAVK